MDERGYEELLRDDELQARIRLAAGQLIAGRIRRARRQAGLTHDRLGELCGGVSRQHLIKLEQAKHRPRANMLRRISAATGREIDWFLDPEVDPSPFPEDGQPGPFTNGVGGVGRDG